MSLFSSHQKAGAEVVKQTDIVAGYSEPTFPERYHLKLRLPVPEAEFLAIVKRLKLYYSVCGERGTSDPLPSLRQRSGINVAKLQKCFEIIGDRDPLQHIGQSWRAFADRHHQIVYIENAFAYTGP